MAQHAIRAGALQLWRCCSSCQGVLTAKGMSVAAVLQLLSVAHASMQQSSTRHHAMMLSHACICWQRSDACLELSVL